jgi:DNA/RNA-binding domain of Phe-tRNA-synthetase-like protein
MTPGEAGTTSGDAARPVGGWLAPRVAEELPGLRLLQSEVEVLRRHSLRGASPPDVEKRLRELSDRVRGARAIGIRREAVPAAYRVFFRQVGIDPDVQRTPIEAIVVERMLRGGFPSGGMLEDILTIALLDTGVPVWALAAGLVHGRLGIRLSRHGEPLGRGADPPPLPEGRLVIADEQDALAVLFGETAPGHEARDDSGRLLLFAVQVPGVPSLFAEEALWWCESALRTP